MWNYDTFELRLVKRDLRSFRHHLWHITPVAIHRKNQLGRSLLVSGESAAEATVLRAMAAPAIKVPVVLEIRVVPFFTRRGKQYYVRAFAALMNADWRAKKHPLLATCC